MVVSVNKEYELIVTGAEVDTWGAKLNSDVFSIIDKNLGGLVSKTLSNVNVTLTTDENRNLILRLSGVLTGAVQIITTLRGMMIVENLTTGAFAVTFSNGFGSPATLAQGVRSLVIADTANGPRVAASDGSEFASGTRMVFNQTNAPTGWTKDATRNNYALRLVSGAVGSGGSVDFTTAFASQGVAGTIGGTALTVGQLPAHTHGFTAALNNISGPTGSGASRPNTVQAGATDSTGSGETHTHSFTGTPINLAVRYADIIIAQKD
jgi:hypothetical protein